MTAHLLAAGAQPGTGEAIGFWVLAPIAVICALGLVLARNAVHAALFLAVDMLSLSVFYAMQGAPFLAFVQVIVYTGAIMMLFLFVLMLIGVDSSDSLVETLRGQRVVAIALGIGFAVLVIAGVGSAVSGLTTTGLGANGGPKNLNHVADLLFSRYVFAFEATSALLITAALGAMVLAHRERVRPKMTQREMMQRRFAAGSRQMAPLPGPGVYANGNAVDVPALLPDGSPATASTATSLQPSGVRPHVVEIQRGDE